LAGFEKQYSCIYKKAGPGHDPKETQANRYMGYLLLPSHLLLAAVKGIDLTVWSNLYHMREQFQVTISALKIRLEQLKLVYVGPDGKVYPSRQEYAGQQRLTP
jgi:Zn-dependent peptidase ImmA (M78 family)